MSRLPNAHELRDRLDNLISVFPFNEYEYIIAYILAAAAISLDEYQELRDRYIARNLFLHVFENSSPRNFGEVWAQGHLKGLVPDLEKPSRKLDPAYAGQYDFLLNGKIKIEVKASRAVASDEEGPLYVRALASVSHSPFWMNFQQIKPSCCDVFVWIAVWRDKIRYWVLSSNEVVENKHYSPGQHRGNVGEGQLHVRQDNIAEFDVYSSRSDRIASAIRAAFRRP